MAMRYSHPPPLQARLVLYFPHKVVLRVTGLGFMVDNVRVPTTFKASPVSKNRNVADSISYWLDATCFLHSRAL